MPSNPHTGEGLQHRSTDPSVHFELHGLLLCLCVDDNILHAASNYQADEGEDVVADRDIDVNIVQKTWRNI